MRTILISAATVVAANSASAADLTVNVRGPDGRPVADAVVMARSARGKPATPIRFAWPLQVTQQGIAFNPHVLIVPVGSEVSFPNKDRVRHHVYSFSTTKRFELKLYGRDETRRVLFDKPGLVPLGCNIHDQMIGYIYVVDTPYAAKTGPSGEVVLKGMTAGAVSLTVWSPSVRKPATLNVQLPENGARQTVSLDIRGGGAAHAH